MKLNVIIAFAVAISFPSFAQVQTKPKVSKSTAEKAALAETNGGKVLSGKYEHESGKYIWSFDIKKGDSTREVWIDPTSGEVLKVSTESPESKKEQKDEETKSVNITQAEAEKIGLKAVPGAKFVTEAELEHESGMFFWSLDLKYKKTDNFVKEVWINPKTGKVIKIFTEKEGNEK